MNIIGNLGYFFAAITLFAAFYVAFGKDLLRITIAFFLELAGISGVLLSLNADYLALAVFGVAVVGVVVVTVFASVIMDGGLKNSLNFEELRNKSKQNPNTTTTTLFRILGLCIGLGLGVVLGRTFLSQSFRSLDRVTLTELNIVQLGKTMMDEQLIVFEMLAIFILIVVIGSGLLLRKPKHGD